ncbi:MAG: SUMF1/EgtB/PvdO family nonheme iron enzyme [Verrucomicrobia bacterium]|nr:SUMF1/EgtB/PvdO family nonheme iron enzyme [Verrucomicrobiota bacterium]
MGRGPAIGRADLARLWQRRVLAEPSATLCGFAQADSVPDSPRRTDDGSEIVSPEPPPPAPAERPVFPKERPKLTFLAAVRAETLDVVTETGPAPRPITEEELGRRWGGGPPLAPLIRWARLGSWLQRRLGLVLATGMPDLRRLVQRVASGLPLRRLPRRSRRVWAPRAVLLWDVSQRFAPFQEDARRLHQRLLREGGRSWLRVVEVTRAPSLERLASASPDVPILALSTLGLRSLDPEPALGWRRLATALRFRGHTLTALVPLEREAWQAQLAAAWPMAEWDAAVRLPRQGGARPLQPPPAADEPVERLLDLLAPAGLVQRPLLRAVRRLLRAGVGVEALAWTHPDCTPQPDYFEFKAEPAYLERLQRRRSLAARSTPDRVLVEAVDALIRAQQRAENPLVRAETELLLGPATEVLLTTLAGVVDRLRDDAARSAAERSLLGGWFGEFFQRAPQTVLSEKDVKEPLAQICALTKHLAGEKEVQWPAGLDIEEAVRELQRIEGREGEVRDGVLSQSGGRLIWSSVLPGPAPLGFFRSRRRWHLWSEAEPSLAPISRRLEGDESPRTLVQLSEPIPLKLSSELQRLEFAPLQRPAWARRFWQDRFGIAAEFRVGDVPFVLRWIPPGRFRMGSPASELGRWDDEGPSHEVGIPRGFWLGETPVTQAQWRAGVEETQRLGGRAKGGGRALQSRPSSFEGPDDAPVESVSWEDGQSFLVGLSGLIGLHFDFPSEAQWEFACRAGSTKAFYDGSDCTQPEGDDPALRELGWFWANSDRTRPVKGKAPNGWGLYDMLGNVWEWCRDARRPYDEVPQVDPSGALDDPDERAIRGGSWADRALLCRCAFRSSCRPGFRDQGLGLRLAAGQELQPAEPGDPQGGAGVEERDLPRRDAGKGGRP